MYVCLTLRFLVWRYVPNTVRDDKYIVQHCSVCSLTCYNIIIIVSWKRLSRREANALLFPCNAYYVQIYNIRG